MPEGQLLRQFARRAKRSLVAASRFSGVERAVAHSGWRQQRLCILCYHGVSMADEHEWLPGLFVTPAFLRRRLEVLRELGCHVLPLGDAVEQLQAGTLPPLSVVLTFDDGFYDFYAAGVAVLEEFEVPATNYVSTYYVQKQRPLLHLGLRYMLWKQRDAGHLLQVDGSDERFALTDGETRERAFRALREQAETLENDRAAQGAWVSRVAASVGFDWSAFADSRILGLMTPAELRDVTERGFDMQLHTHRHRTPRDQAAFTDEIVRNKTIMEDITGQPMRHFCYPSGDYDRRFLPWLSEAGVDTATIGVPALASAEDHVLLLPRYIDTMLQTESTFISRVTGLNDRMRLRALRP